MFRCHLLLFIVIYCYLVIFSVVNLCINEDGQIFLCHLLHKLLGQWSFMSASRNYMIFCWVFPKFVYHRNLWNLWNSSAKSKSKDKDNPMNWIGWKTGSNEVGSRWEKMDKEAARGIIWLLGSIAWRYMFVCRDVLCLIVQWGREREVRERRRL